MPNNLTDNEIKKALEEYSVKYNLTYNGKQAKATLDLINRLQAENERLKNDLNEIIVEYQRLDDTVTNGAEVCHNCHLKYAEKIKQAKAEAYKECIEKVKKRAELSSCSNAVNTIADNVLKELVGEINASKD